MFEEAVQEFVFCYKIWNLFYGSSPHKSLFDVDRQQILES